MTYIPMTLTEPIGIGAIITGLSVTSIQIPIAIGDIIAVTSGLDSQSFIAYANQPATSSPTVISIQDEAASFSFPVGSYVVDTTTAQPELLITPIDTVAISDGVATITTLVETNLVVGNYVTVFNSRSATTDEVEYGQNVVLAVPTSIFNGTWEITIVSNPVGGPYGLSFLVNEPNMVATSADGWVSTGSYDSLVLWNFLPPFIQQQDISNDYEFLCWLEGAGSQQQIIDNLVRDAGGNPGWSIALDVTRCPGYALPWLAQFIGLRFTAAEAATEAAMRAAITGDVAGTLNAGNWGRGALAAVIAAAAPTSIQVIEQYPDPYSVTFIIPSSGEAATEARIIAALPAGLLPVFLNKI